ncbi:MAG: VCBS repeat-containing protein [Planctomycetes bacterium]|nr:VCBS repeat-containing protein [Planctomycetota bacterium]
MQAGKDEDINYCFVYTACIQGGQPGAQDNLMSELKTTVELDPAHYDAHYDIWKTQMDDTKDEAAKNQLKDKIRSELETMLKNDKPTDKLYANAFFIYNDMGDADKREEVKRRFLKEFPASDKIKDIGQESFETILAEQDRPKRVPIAMEYVNDFPKHEMADIAYQIILRYYWKEEKEPIGVREQKIKEYTAKWIEDKPQSALALQISARICSEMNLELKQAETWATRAVKLVEDDMAKCDKMHTPPSDSESVLSSGRTCKPDWYDEWQCPNEPRPYEVLDALGWVYFKQNNLAKAEECLTKAIGIFDFHSRIWYHLGKVQEAQGKIDEAINSYIQSLVCRGDIPETESALKEALKKKYPSLTESYTPVLHKPLPEQVYTGLYQIFAAQKGLAYFTDVTEQAGFDKARGQRIAWGDYDNDGYQDILLSGSRLWRNRGDGTFEDVTVKAGISGLPAEDSAQAGGYSGGVWADYNNDGHLDFFSSGEADALWRNNGDSTFSNVTAEINPKLSDGYPTEGAGWGDYDRDGFVDLYVANYERPFAVGNPDFLYHNIRGAKFEDVTESAGVKPPKDMCGRGVSWADYNDDGWPDIFVSNYRLNPDFLWRNNGNGTFTNAAKAAGVEGKPVKGAYGHTIGSDWADYDNDGDLDLFQGNLAHPRYIEFSNMSYLLTNSGAPDYRFTECRKQSGIRFEETHSDPGWADYDNDGLLDLYITSVYDGPPAFLYRQSPKGSFTDVTWLSGVRVTDGWGCAWADYDNDGDLDLFVCTSQKARGKDKGNVYLFRNETISLDVPRSLFAKSGAHNYLEVKLIGKDCPDAPVGTPRLRQGFGGQALRLCNRAAIGARVMVKAGESQYMREVQGGKGTTTQSSMVQHFGLGNWRETVEVIIRWPCGRAQTVTTLPNRIVTVTENE